MQLKQLTPTCPTTGVTPANPDSSDTNPNPKTGTKKVLAFVYPYYSEKYGYIPTGSYSFKLDSSGKFLFMVWNGAFIEPADDIGVDFWGHCSIMLLYIPESERIE